MLSVVERRPIDDFAETQNAAMPTAGRKPQIEEPLFEYFDFERVIGTLREATQYSTQSYGIPLGCDLQVRMRRSTIELVIYDAQDIQQDVHEIPVSNVSRFGIYSVEQFNSEYEAEELDEPRDISRELSEKDREYIAYQTEKKPSAITEYLLCRNDSTRLILEFEKSSAVDRKVFDFGSIVSSYCSQNWTTVITKQGKLFLIENSSKAIHTIEPKLRFFESMEFAVMGVDTLYVVVRTKEECRVIALPVREEDLIKATQLKDSSGGDSDITLISRSPFLDVFTKDSEVPNGSWKVISAASAAGGAVAGAASVAGRFLRLT